MNDRDDSNDAEARLARDQQAVHPRLEPSTKRERLEARYDARPCPRCHGPCGAQRKPGSIQGTISQPQALTARHQRVILWLGNFTSGPNGGTFTPAP